MLVVDLACAHGHRFEGWFQSSDDLASQQARGLLTCPVCGHHEIERRPSATRYNRSGMGDGDMGLTAPKRSAEIDRVDAGTMQAEESARAAEMVAQLQSLYFQAVKQVMAVTEDVGDRFVEQVRSMHEGEEPVRPIRGQASADDAQALREEGIDVVTMLVPDALKEPLQ
ncbi:MAG: DUF1178 family protein [Acidobacteriota bacterium]